MQVTILKECCAVGSYSEDSERGQSLIRFHKFWYRACRGGSRRGSLGGTHTGGGTVILAPFFLFFKSFIYTGKYNRSLVTCFHYNPDAMH